LDRGSADRPTHSPLSSCRSPPLASLGRRPRRREFEGSSRTWGRRWCARWRRRRATWPASSPPPRPFLLRQSSGKAVAAVMNPLGPEARHLPRPRRHRGGAEPQAPLEEEDRERDHPGRRHSHQRCRRSTPPPATSSPRASETTGSHRSRRRRGRRRRRSWRRISVPPSGSCASTRPCSARSASSPRSRSRPRLPTGSTAGVGAGVRRPSRRRPTYRRGPATARSSCRTVRHRPRERRHADADRRAERAAAGQ